MAQQQRSGGRSGLEALGEATPSGLWLRPLGVLAGETAAAPTAAPLANSFGFAAVEILARRPAGGIVTATASLAELHGWVATRDTATRDRIAGLLARLAAPRPPWAGLPLDRPRLMGIVNVTPDSFSDGGDFAASDAAIAQGRALLAAGADILDIGGESTRPGATPLSPEEETRRVEPVVRALAAAGALVSIDTRHAAVMAAALAAGARIINDVSALAGEPASLAVAARSDAAVVLMHMQGEPATMQRDPIYALASLDVLEFLAGRVAACIAGGIAPARIIVDPGIGFGKRPAHNLEILHRLALFHALGCGVMVGLSRKSLIGAVAGTIPAKERLPGSLAGALYALGQGVQLLRVHDIAETRQAVATWEAISRGAA